MDFITLTHMIENLKNKEEFYFAVFSVYLKKGVDVDQLQKYIDNFCSKYSSNFIKENKNIFNNIENRTLFLRKLTEFGANIDKRRRLLGKVYDDLMNYSKDEIEEEMV